MSWHRAHFQGRGFTTLGTLFLSAWAKEQLLVLNISSFTPLFMNISQGQPLSFFVFIPRLPQNRSIVNP